MTEEVSCSCMEVSAAMREARQQWSPMALGRPLILWLTLSYSPFAAPRFPLYPSPYSPFGSPYSFSPFVTPRFPFYSSPYSPFGSPYLYSPFAAPRSPLYSSPYSPFGYPFSPSYPYSGEFAPYSYAPALPSEVYPQYEAPTRIHID
jgi:hypothetical protein